MTVQELRHDEVHRLLQLRTSHVSPARPTAQPRDRHSRCLNPAHPFRYYVATWPVNSFLRRRCQREKSVFQVAGAQSCEHSSSMARAIASPASLPKMLEAGRTGPVSSSSTFSTFDRYLSNCSDCCSMHMPRPRLSRYAAFFDRCRPTANG